MSDLSWLPEQSRTDDLLRKQIDEWNMMVKRQIPKITVLPPASVEFRPEGEQGLRQLVREEVTKALYALRSEIVADIVSMSEGEFMALCERIVNGDEV